eukprot:CAMPEP_0194385626 /NCGR_PEP_ID=MMETSP0174-20130528/81340_1 /TAXON_ID=216777 /ORGANISM="Proboscia alata, Strain PI-D3" /LENGTH=446 /DNA_ID=CAMNT_0039173927 /DNA_START=200 /DNA_END=1537 /DNA_ORIENTATION=+
MVSKRKRSNHTNAAAASGGVTSTSSSGGNAANATTTNEANNEGVATLGETSASIANKFSPPTKTMDDGHLVTDKPDMVQICPESILIHLVELKQDPDRVWRALFEIRKSTGNRTSSSDIGTSANPSTSKAADATTIDGAESSGIGKHVLEMKDLIASSTVGTASQTAVVNDDRKSENKNKSTRGKSRRRRSDSTASSNACTNNRGEIDSDAEVLGMSLQLLHQLLLRCSPSSSCTSLECLPCVVELCALLADVLTSVTTTAVARISPSTNTSATNNCSTKKDGIERNVIWREAIVAVTVGCILVLQNVKQQNFIRKEHIFLSISTLEKLLLLANTPSIIDSDFRNTNTNAKHNHTSITSGGGEADTVGMVACEQDVMPSLMELLPPVSLTQQHDRLMQVASNIVQVFHCNNAKSSSSKRQQSSSKKDKRRSLEQQFVTFSSHINEK